MGRTAARVLGTAFGRWICLDIKGVTIDHNIRLQRDRIADRLHDVAAIFGIADDASQAFRWFVRFYLQARFNAITTPLDGLPQHRAFGTKIGGHVDARLGDIDFHHVAVPANLSQQSKAQGQGEVREGRRGSVIPTNGFRFVTIDGKAA